MDCEGGISGCPVLLVSGRLIRLFDATRLFVDEAHADSFRASHGAVARGFKDSIPRLCRTNVSKASKTFGFDANRRPTILSKLPFTEQCCVYTIDKHPLSPYQGLCGRSNPNSPIGSHP